MTFHIKYPIIKTILIINVFLIGVNWFDVLFVGDYMPMYTLMWMVAIQMQLIIMV